MKRILGIALGMALFGSGCLNLPAWKKEPAPTSVSVAQPPSAPPIVTAEQVNEKNAREQVKALGAELEYDEAHALTRGAN